MSMTKSSITRWMDDLGSHVPTPEAMLQPLLARTPATEGPMDGAYPLGTDKGVLVVQDAPDRLLLTPEATSEHGEEARKWLETCKAHGLHVTAALSDDSQSVTDAIQSVSPQARLQADHVHTVKHIWGHLKQSLCSYRRTIKARGEATQDETCLALAKKVWALRWRLLKKPSNGSVEDKQAMTELESEDEGFVHRCRRMVRQLVTLFDHAPSDTQAKRRRPQLRKDMPALADPHLDKMPTCFDDHWEHALRYLRKQSMGKHRRGSNAESGMRLLRRLEKNHDGIRSAATRQHSRQI